MWRGLSVLCKNIGPCSSWKTSRRKGEVGKRIGRNGGEASTKKNITVRLVCIFCLPFRFLDSQPSSSSLSLFSFTLWLSLHDDSQYFQRVSMNLVTQWIWLVSHLVLVIWRTWRSLRDIGGGEMRTDDSYLRLFHLILFSRWLFSQPVGLCWVPPFADGFSLFVRCLFRVKLLLFAWLISHVSRLQFNSGVCSWGSETDFDGRN